MKSVISQEGAKLFTIGTNQLINISLMPPDTELNYKVYSVGIESISFGLFRRLKKAENVLLEIAEFIGDRDELFYKVPFDEQV